MSDSLLDRARRRLRRDYCKWRYANAVRKIVQTPPLSRGNLPFMLLSMVHTRDVLSYLVAVKSFARQANPESIVVVCDPTISDADRALLREQIPHIELRDAETFAHPGVPRGGCWERLQAIAHYSPHHYVVQLDADTVTTGPVDSVCAAIRSRTGFVLGEERGQRLLTLAESSARAAPLLAPNAHVQTHSEAALASIGLPQERLYVRGCAGFTGFPSQPDLLEKLLDFNARMKNALGERWASWGTEQVTSNFLVANAPGTTVLPFPEYGTPDVISTDSALIHFIGSMRFINHLYRDTSLAAIAALARPH